MSEGRHVVAGVVADEPGLRTAVEPGLHAAHEVAAQLEILEDWLGMNVDATQATALEVKRAAEAVGGPELVYPRPPRAR